MSFCSRHRDPADFTPGSSTARESLQHRGDTSALSFQSTHGRGTHCCLVRPRMISRFLKACRSVLFSGQAWISRNPAGGEAGALRREEGASGPAARAGYEVRDPCLPPVLTELHTRVRVPAQAHLPHPSPHSPSHPWARPTCYLLHGFQDVQLPRV